MKKIKNILIFSLFAISCQNTNYKEQIITFNLKELPETSNIKLSDLGFVNIEYLPLETNEQSMISDINYLKAGNDIFLTQFYNTILTFKSDGSFVTKIGTEGRGPAEFLVAHDVGIDNKNQLIYILSGWQKKFLVYSYMGEFIRTFPILFYANDFRLIEDGILCYSWNTMGKVAYSYNLIDTNGEIKKKFPNMYIFNKPKEGAYGYDHENLFYHFDDRLFKKEVYSDTIYGFENMDFKPHLVVEVGNKLITPKARMEISGSELAKNYIIPLNLFEFGDYIYYEFIYEFMIGKNNLVYGFIGSKKSDFRAFINSELGFINDLDGGPNVSPKTIKDDNTIIAWVDAFQLKAHVASEDFRNSKPKYPEKKEELKKLADSLNETDNPVLIVVTPKN